MTDTAGAFPCCTARGVQSWRVCLRGSVPAAGCRGSSGGARHASSTEFGVRPYCVTRYCSIIAPPWKRRHGCRPDPPPTAPSQHVPSALGSSRSRTACCGPHAPPAAAHSKEGPLPAASDTRAAAASPLGKHGPRYLSLSAGDVPVAPAAIIAAAAAAPQPPPARTSLPLLPFRPESPPRPQSSNPIGCWCCL